MTERNPSRLRILISGQTLGGTGGVERYLHATCWALEEERVDVCVNQCLGGPLAILPSGVRLINRIWWRGQHPRHSALGPVGRALRPIQRARFPRYDLLIEHLHGPQIHRWVDASVAVLVPGGSSTGTRERGFDHVLMEAPSNLTLLDNPSRGIVLPPPVGDLASHSTPVPDLPARYLLTVFNPYGPVKGADVLDGVADSLPLPVVWCLSGPAGKLHIPARLLDHPNVIPLRDLPPQQLRFLYEQCEGYVSFSLHEGFGWALADALQYGAPIVARRTGVLTIEGLDLRAVETYEDPADIPVLASQVVGARTSRNTDVIGPERFRAAIRHLLSEHRAS